MRNAIAITLGICGTITAGLSILAAAPATQPAARPDLNMLIGAWHGQKDGTSVTLHVRAKDVTWRLEQGNSSIAAQMKRIDGKDGTINLRLDYVVTANGERHSDVVGQIKVEQANKASLTVLPIATKVKAADVAVANIALIKSDN